MKLLPVQKRVSGRRHRLVYEVSHYAMVDDEFYEELTKYRWIPQSAGYVTTTLKSGKTMYLHRKVWRLAGRKLPKRKMSLDHKDRNKLNCQIKNIRIASRSIQGANQKLRRNNTSGHRGVHWYKPRKRWSAEITINKQHVVLGRFKSKKKAIRTYRTAFNAHFPEVELDY